MSFWTFISFLLIMLLLKVILEEPTKRKKCQIKKFSTSKKANIKTIVSKENYIKKGLDYENQVKEFYINNGYYVYHNSKVNGKNDKGIDLIAHTTEEIRLIQCKCYKNPPKQELIRKFIGDCELYIKYNQEKIKDRKIYKDFVTSCPEINYGVKKFLEEYPEEINYKIIQ